MRALQSVGAFLGLVILVVGPPVALVRSVGNPWPAEGITLDAPLTDGAIIGVLAVLVWVLWAQLLVRSSNWRAGSSRSFLPGRLLYLF